MKDFDIDKVWFAIRKSTPKRYDRMCVYRQRNGTYKITLTSSDGTEHKDYSECKTFLKHISSFYNHELLHVILGICVSDVAGHDYDELLKTFNRYTNFKIMVDMI